MTCPPRPDMALSALEAALAGDRLTPAARESAKRLVRRLSRPVRLALLGLPGAGKTQLLNMLAGREVIPGGVAHPTLTLRHGPQIVTHMHFQGGGVETCDGLAPADLLQHRPVRVEIEAPLPILERVSLSEVVADASVEGQRAAVAEAVENADMLLWCTQEFADPEPVLWSLVPEALKDHAFLVLTKADILHQRGLLRARLDSFADLVGESFHSVYPVATTHALAALARGAQDQIGFTGSGGRALVKAIYKHVAQGRQADLDNALLFLSRHAGAETEAEEHPDAAQASLAEAAPGATVAPPPESVTPGGHETVVVDDPVPAAHDAPAADTAEQDADLRAQAFADAMPEQTEPPVDRPAPQPQSRTSEAAEPVLTAALRAKALRVLEEGAAALPEPPEAPDKAVAAEILETCTETLDRLSLLCAESEAVTPCPFAEDVEEAAEMGLLLQVEGGVGAAADAVTLLLQLRRGLAA